MTRALERRVSFEAGRTGGEVSALLISPPEPRGMLVLGHGAGAGMTHRFMAELCRALASQRVATMRYQFPYMERGLRRPDPRPVLLKTVRRAVAQARQLAPDSLLLAGGKSMGGRMTSLAASQEDLEGVAGIVFYGFPLHPAGSPGTERARHLGSVRVPLLFIQGTRDRLADLELLGPVVAGLGARAALHVVDGADHGFGVLKRSGRSGAEVMSDLATVTADWMKRLATGG